MKLQRIGLALGGLVAGMTLLPGAQAGDFLEGDQKTACEVLMCLSTGNRPDECDEPLKDYQKIRPERRAGFLHKCPKEGGGGAGGQQQTSEQREQEDQQFDSFTDAAVESADTCDATTLNATLLMSNPDGSTYVSNQMPQHCTSYASHAYSTYELPVYVGVQGVDGHWEQPALVASETP